MSMEPHEHAPAPSPELLAKIRAMRPVTLRHPERQVVRVMAASLLYAAAWLVGPATWIWGRALRADLAQLPRAWLIGFGVMWLLGFAAPLCVAMLPRRGQVLHRVSAAAAAVWIALVVVGTTALLAQVAPGASQIAVTRAQLLSVTAQCTAALLSIAVVPTTLALWALRRAIPIGWAAVAGAIGAAGGALGGLALHLHCPWAEPMHVLLGHAAPVALMAAIAAVIGYKVLAP